MIRLEVNGMQQALDLPPDMPLLWALRDHLRLTGTKYGCGMALCGACTVHLDGTPARACATTVASAAGKTITTIEGLAGPEVNAVREAWQSLEVPQCGYCQSGQIMAATALLRNKPAPQEADIDTAMAGNLCRCATYPRIRAAIRQAAASLAA